MNDKPIPGTRSTKAVRDLIVISALSIVVYGIESYLNGFGAFLRWYQESHADEWQLDEMFMISIILVFAFAAFSFRRWKENGQQIEQRIKTGEALSASEEKYRSLIESIPDVTVITDSHGNVSFISPNYLQHYGFTPEEAYEGGADFWLGRIHPDDKRRVAQAFASIFDGGSYDIEYRFQRKDGRWIWTQDRAIRTYKEDGVVLVYILLTDITERKHIAEDLARARDAALESTRLKSEFLANMSHEIRTPMNGIIGMTELTLDTVLSVEQREYLTMVKGAAVRLLIIIGEILDFSKIEAGKLNLDATEFDLRDCVAGVITSLALRAREKNLELTTDISRDVPEVLVGDAGRLRQILLNLVGNAIKFTEAGEVRVRACSRGQTDTELCLQLSVTDTGIGIATSMQEHIFHSFTQADGSTTRKYGGTGLGLAISSQLVEMMGGKIWVESELGQGSTFHFIVRLEQQASQSTRVTLAALGSRLPECASISTVNHQ